MATASTDTKVIYKSSKGIYGKLVNDDSRCVYYHSPLDVIANKCGRCKKFYSCFKCHDELEDHKFEPVESSEAETVMCGICGKTFSYKEYCGLIECPSCKSPFNPMCAVHRNFYTK